MKRRSFLRSGSVFSLPVALGGVNIGVLANSKLNYLFEEENDRIFVLIQKNGGNDGLNMVIPTDQYKNLSAHRSSILIPENQLLKLSDTIGFHPTMSGLKSLYDDQILSIIQSVGYPNQNRSHFRSTDIWDSGSQAQEIITTGWIGRYLDQLHGGYPEGYPNNEFPHPVAITLGPTVSETCQGIAANFSLAINDPTALATIPGIEGDPLPDLPYGDELTFLRQIVEQTNVYSKVLKDISEKGTNQSSLYPEPGVNSLADQLKTVAQLISGGLQTKIYVANINGFDTHANQVTDGDVTVGDHATLLSNLSEAVMAFVDDLRIQGLDRRVIGATRSEFGRQIAANGSLGTDHGDAAPLLIFGTCVNARIIGNNPEILPEIDPQAGVKPQFDFKDIFGSILIDWFNVAESDINQIFSHEFKHIPLVTGCATTSTPENNLDRWLKFSTYPNPFFEKLTVSFESPGSELKLSLINSLGQEIIQFDNRFFQKGSHEISYQIPEIPPGNYLCRINGKGIMKSVPLIHF